MKPAWHAHVHDEFLRRIVDGTLPVEGFKKFLVQDYLYLVSSRWYFASSLPFLLSTARFVPSFVIGLGNAVGQRGKVVLSQSRT